MDQQPAAQQAASRRGALASSHSVQHGSGCPTGAHRRAARRIASSRSAAFPCPPPGLSCCCSALLLHGDIAAAPGFLRPRRSLRSWRGAEEGSTKSELTDVVPAYYRLFCRLTGTVTETPPPTTRRCDSTTTPRQPPTLVVVLLVELERGVENRTRQSGETRLLDDEYFLPPAAPSHRRRVTDDAAGGRPALLQPPAVSGGATSAALLVSPLTVLPDSLTSSRRWSGCGTKGTAAGGRCVRICRFTRWLHRAKDSRGRFGSVSGSAQAHEDLEGVVDTPLEAGEGADLTGGETGGVVRTKQLGRSLCIYAQRCWCEAASQVPDAGRAHHDNTEREAAGEEADHAHLRDNGADGGGLVGVELADEVVGRLGDDGAEDTCGAGGAATAQGAQVRLQQNRRRAVPNVQSRSHATSKAARGKRRAGCINQAPSLRAAMPGAPAM